MTQNLYLPEGSLLHTDENRDCISSLEGLERAMNEGRILEAPAVCCSSSLKLGVELGDSLLGELAREDCVFPLGESFKDIAVITRVGKPVAFKVTEISREPDGTPLVRLSRAEAQRECVENFLSRLTPGDIIPAKVTHLEHFGAFVDIGCGVVSLLSIDSISVSRISHPRDRLSVGTELSVVVKAVEHQDGQLSRIFVSRKELLGTWEENAARFEVGQTVTGIVRSIESYGIFIELAPNLAGLAEYRSDVSVGQSAAVYIKSIIPERMKLKLVIVDPSRSIPRRDDPRIFVPEGVTHISRWKYSPDCAEKLVETVFE